MANTRTEKPRTSMSLRIRRAVHSLQGMNLKERMEVMVSAGLMTPEEAAQAIAKIERDESPATPA